jgi:hypothetical protein
MRHGFPFAVMVCLTLTAACDSAEPPPKKTWYEKAVSKLEAKFEPAEAKPGQTVTFTLTVELNPGYTTYPTMQADPMASGMVNTIRFPEKGDVVFVGDVADPAGFKTKAELEVGVKEIRYYTGKVTYARTAVVSPAAKPGDLTVTIPSFRLSVCDDKNCFPPKALTPEAKLKVLDGPPVAVDPKYADEVKKAGGM